MTDNNIVEKDNIITACDGAVENTSTAEDIRNTLPEKTFTQSQLEALISDRLKRERKNAENLRSVKDLLTKLSDSGTIKSSSYSGMASELIELLSDKKDGTEETETAVGNISDVPEENNSEYVAQALSDDEQSDGKAQTDALPCEKTVVSEQKNLNDFALTADMARAIKRAYPECDIGELLCEGSFEAFSKGRSGSPEEIYKDYLTFLTAIENREGNIERRMFADTASTSFSASDKAYCSDGSEGLSKRQMEIARQNGMSYREYAGLLSSIPHPAKKF